jgi:XFP-like protein
MSEITDLRDGEKPLTDAELKLIDAWWRAANYLSVGQIYLLDNPLLREPLAIRHITSLARPLGDDTRPQLHLRPPQSSDQSARSRCDLRCGIKHRDIGLTSPKANVSEANARPLLYLKFKVDL